MKTWQRAQSAVKCGSCGVWVQVGAPILAIELDGLARRLLRCEGCAGEPVDEAAIAEHDRLVAVGTEERARRIVPCVPEPARLFDAKLAAAGRDEL